MIMNNHQRMMSGELDVSVAIKTAVHCGFEKKPVW
jgi:hypothetical protein